MNEWQEGVAVGRSFSMLKNYHIDGNKEMIAFGMMNIAGSCTTCYLTTGAFSVRSLQENMGHCKGRWPTKHELYPSMINQPRPPAHMVPVEKSASWAILCQPSYWAGYTIICEVWTVRLNLLAIQRRCSNLQTSVICSLFLISHSNMLLQGHFPGRQWISMQDARQQCPT